MKTIQLILLIIFLTSFSTNTQAQDKIHWRAVYHHAITMDTIKQDSLIKANPMMKNVFKQMKKRFSDMTYFLDFTKQESVYQREEELEKPSKKGEMSISFSMPRPVTYYNHKTKQYVDEKSGFQNQFLVIDSLPDYKWKVTDETKQIGQYLVIKAIGTSTLHFRGTKKKKEIIAWFTPQIPISEGPELYKGLPGLIMQLDIDRSHFLCKEIITNPKKFNKIEKPTEGKKVSEEAYYKIMNEQMEKFRKIRKRKNRKRDNNNIIIIGG